uniref:Ig-like domain-containing protein n=1 Tax=Kryptolebias marmoratus TaxID=37003 RepID=A0A3Q3BJS6_KRYMA
SYECCGILFTQCFLSFVITVQLGEPATLTCDLPDVWLGLKSLYWYKQDVGNSLKLITMLRKNTNPEYGPGVLSTRFNVTCYEKISSLTILGAVKEDEGMYHCAVISWTENTWIQQPAATDPDHPGGSVTLQCSILSDSEKKTCPGDLSVFWFRARSKDSHPDIIYTNGNSTDNCEKKSDPQKSCVYHFFKNISSSDAGTYYCAVATCGEIIFILIGNGTKLETGMILFCRIKIIYLYTERGQDLNYAALHFSGEKSTRGKKDKESKTEESVYSHVKL